MIKQTKIGKNTDSTINNMIDNASNGDCNALNFDNTHRDNSAIPTATLTSISNLSENNAAESNDISTIKVENKGNTNENATIEVKSKGNTNENATIEIESKSADNTRNDSESDSIENIDYSHSINEGTSEDYAVIDPYEICEFQSDEVTNKIADVSIVDTGDTLNEQVHNMSVSLIKDKCGSIFLPFIIIGIPFLILAVGSFLILSPLTAIIWSLLSISVYSLKLSPENKGGFKNFFKLITDKTLLSATAVYRIMTLFLTLLFFLPSLIIRLNYCMFPFILKDKRDAGENPSMIDLFAESKELMTGHRLEYLSLMIYSLLAVILTVLTLGIISIWSIPYLTALKANFYASIKTEMPITTPSDNQ